jgi:hypothetical protein
MRLPRVFARISTKIGAAARNRDECSHPKGEAPPVEIGAKVERAGTSSGGLAMGEERMIDPGHDNARVILRTVGPVLALVGLGFLIVGLVSFFSAFGTFEPPRYFWCFFAGIPLLGIGVALTKFAYMGAIFRYVAGETAPVGKDTFNYLAHGTSPGVREMARAVGEGFTEGTHPGPHTVACPKCLGPNPAANQFCGNCGAALSGGVATGGHRGIDEE